eukprot:TRINITY_DN2456_c0_g1_i2.p1 TRINITY_DN2456_c0_g1~~TRINITY_DN2456_c0_g1_i2.p1  ORF type:complete len:707 (-),score=225.37 TRINITY_DN2456_c0_g1_i2:64-2184(-)
MVFAAPEKPDPKHAPTSTTKIIKKLEEAGLKLRLYKSVQKDEVYCLIGATEARLEDEAHRIEMDLSLDRDRCIDYGSHKGLILAKKAKDRDEFCNDDIGDFIFANLYGKFTKETRELYTTYNDEGPQHAGSVFRQVDRLKLIVSIMEAPVKLGGGGLAIGDIKNEPGSFLKACFPLHDENNREILLKKWSSWKNVIRQPLEDIRHYFGEDVALYFQFLEYYNRSLVIVAVLGLLFYVGGIAKLDFEHYYKAKGMWFFAIVMAVWGTLFIEFWKRIEATRRMIWGQSKFEENEQTRPEFRGSWTRSPITGKLEERFPWFLKFVRQLVSQTVIFTYIICVIVCVVGVFLLRGILVSNNVSNGKVWAGIINSVQIQIFNVVYGKIAVWLNNFENHRTDTEYRDALIFKSFMFKFVNSYNSLFYMAFGQAHEKNPSLRCDYFPTDNSNSCMYNLQVQLATVFISSIVINNAMELGIPFLMNLYSKMAQSKTASGDKAEAERLDALKTPAEKQYELSEYESTLGDFDEMAVQFGYVTLFVVAFPLTPLFALANNVLELFVDSKKLITLTRRPEPRGAGDIGTWSDIFTTIGCVAIVTNVMVAIIAFEEWEIVTGGDLATKLLIFLGAEHVIFLVRFGIQYCVPDVPGDVETHLARQDYVVDVLINGVDEEEDHSELLILSRKDSLQDAGNFFEMDKVPDELLKDEHLTTFT